MPKYASSGAAGVPVPKPKMNAVNAFKNPPKKQNKPKSGAKTATKQSKPQTSSGGSLTQVYLAAAVLFIVVIIILVYLMTPPEVNHYKQRQFEATLRVQKLDNVPISFNNAYSDQNSDSSKFLKNELTERVNASFVKNGIKTDEIRIEEIRKGQSSGSTRNLRYFYLDNAEDSDESAPVEIVFSTWASISENFYAFFGKFADLLRFWVYKFLLENKIF